MIIELFQLGWKVVWEKFPTTSHTPNFDERWESYGVSKMSSFDALLQARPGGSCPVGWMNV